MSSSVRVKKWLPLEANPTVMEEFLKPLGFPATAGLHDVYGFDDDLLSFVPQPVLGVLLLFPENEQAEAAKKQEAERIQRDGQFVSKKVWFTLQTVGNACGTVGLLHAVGNNREALHLAEGSYLDRFFKSTSAMSPQERAQFLADDTEMESAHSAAAVDGDTAAPDIAEPVNFHFVAFVHVDGALYELDGSRAFPINHGPSSPETLLKDSVSVIQEYMRRNPDTIQFNVIALSGGP